MSGRYNIHLVRSRTSYTLSEVANLFGIDRKTCGRWVKDEGLKTIEENTRSLLIMGEDLISFIKNKRQKLKIPTKEDEFYCFKCRQAVRAKIGSEQVVKTGKRIGKNNEEQLKKVGICEKCKTRLNKFL